MKKIIFKNVCFIAILNILVVLFVLRCGSVVEVNNRYLTSRLSNTKGSGSVMELINLDYDRVYSFEPYQSKESMEKLIGFEYGDLKENISTHMMNILFVKDNQPVAYLYGPPNDNGFYLNLPIGTYTQSDFATMSYDIEIQELGNSAGTPQTYTFYSFRK